MTQTMTQALSLSPSIAWRENKKNPANSINYSGKFSTNLVPRDPRPVNGQPQDPDTRTSLAFMLSFSRHFTSDASKTRKRMQTEAKEVSITTVKSIKYLL